MAQLEREWTEQTSVPQVHITRTGTNQLPAELDNPPLALQETMKQDRKDRPQEPTLPPSPRFELSEDLRIARINGSEYPLTKSQGKMLAVLWSAHQNGKLVTREALCSAIGRGKSGCDPRDTWRGHPFWGNIIVPGKPGFYRLKLRESDI